MHLLCTFSKQKFDHVNQATELWRQKWYSLRSMFQGNRVLSHVTYSHWKKWRYYALFMSGDDHIWPLTLHLDLSKVIQARRPWLTPYILVVAKLMFFFVCVWGGFLTSWDWIRAQFFYTDIFIVLLKYIRCQTILQMRVTLLPSGMLCITNIPSINCNAHYFVQNWTRNTLVKVLCCYN